jgi:Mrp family chromosome partitioning ATPase
VIGAARNAGTTMTAIALVRSLAARSRVVLVECALASPNLSVIASDPRAPGLSELVQGSASFGQIITRDRHSRAHLILAGRAAVDGAALMQSERLSIAVEALARSYDHVIIDAGAADDLPLDCFATLAPRAVLIAADLSIAAAAIMRERLLKAGFVNVSVVADAPPPGSETPADSKAAA